MKPDTRPAGKSGRAMPEIELKENERIDDLKKNGYRIIQNSRRFCFGIDGVLLTGFARIREGEHVLDLGTGTGIIPILLAAKTGAAKLTGLEIQPESADMAKRSVALNGLEGRVEIITGDIREARELFGGSVFDAVTSNPPYMIAGHGLKNPDSEKSVARHEVLCKLEDVVSQAAAVLKPGGHFYMVHRPFRLAEIITRMCAHGLEPKRLRLVYPYRDREPKLLLIEGVRGGNPRMKVEQPLILFDSPGVYSGEIVSEYGF